MQRAGGLYPAPLPQDAPDTERVARLFMVLGVFLAKSLQDSRLVDLPLSLPFLKLLCWSRNSDTGSLLCPDGTTIQVFDDATCSLENLDESYTDTTNELDLPQPSLEENENAINKMDSESSKERELIEEEEEQEELSKEENSELSKTKESVEEIPLKSVASSWFEGIMNDNDFMVVDPHRASFLKQLQELVATKKEILSDDSLSSNQKKAMITALKLKTTNGVECSVEDLG